MRFLLDFPLYQDLNLSFPTLFLYSTMHPYLPSFLPPLLQLFFTSLSQVFHLFIFFIAISHLLSCIVVLFSFPPIVSLPSLTFPLLFLQSPLLLDLHMSFPPHYTFFAFSPPPILFQLVPSFLFSIPISLYVPLSLIHCL